VQRATNIVALRHLMALALNDSAAPQARAIAFAELDRLRGWLKAQTPADPNQRAHYQFGVRLIEKFQQEPKPENLPKLVEPPPGQPIG